MTGLLIAATLAGCISQPLAPESNEIREIRLTPNSLESESGRLAAFTVEAIDGEGRTIPSAEISWTSSDPMVAVVDGDGTVWSFKEGSADVTAHPGRGGGRASAPGQVKKSASVTVQPTQEARPGRVDDLEVESIQNASVNLTFTEVDDGTGAPADYIVRFQIAPIDWGLAAGVLHGTCAGRVAGTEIGATRICSVSGLAEGTTYEFQLVAIRGSSSDPIYGELSNVVSATMPSADGPAPESDGGLVTHHSFGAPVEDGWAEPIGSFSHGSEDGDGYGQANYNPNLCVGCAPINVWRVFPVEYDEVTVKLRWRLSPNFDHATGSHNKKILFLQSPTTDPIIFGVKAGGGFLFNLQRTAEPGGGARTFQGGSWSPGTEYEIKIYVKLNSVDEDGNSIADGVVRVYVNGRQVISASDVRYRGNDGSVSGSHWEPKDGISAIKWNPTWPNVGDPPAESMWERIYDIEVWNGQM